MDYAIMSSDEDFSTSDTSDSTEESDYDTQPTQQTRRQRRRLASEAVQNQEQHSGPNNLILKLFNRERTGYLYGNGSTLQFPSRQRAFNIVPNRLGFCLKDIVPHCFLQGHMFMGLSACGQFLLSYKVCCNDNVAANHYSFNIGYKYHLYFWIYQPHKPLRSFYKCCLFDDHGVDNLKEVTMTQWKKCTDPRVLIVHGAAEDENEDSYITYIKVPRLGCLDCKKLREMDDDGFFRCYALCLRCNLTIHTKYSPTESDRKFNAYMNLLCPERLIIVANGFLHMLHIDLELSSAPSAKTAAIPHVHTSQLSPKASPAPSNESTSLSVERRSNQSTTLNEENTSCDNHNTIVARIIADFSDIETDNSTHSSGGRSRFNDLPQTSASNNATQQLNDNSSNSSTTCISRKTYDELIFTCNGSSSSSATTMNASQTSTSSAISKGGTTKVSLISHRGKRHHRIVTKSYRNGVTTVDLQGSSTSSTAAVIDKSNAYEFSEDNEKCEKIATLRKRRLADKKYEFSEDNSENIIPFTKIRSANKSLTANLFGGSLHRATATAAHHFHNSPCASPSSSPHPSQASSSGCDSRHCTPPPTVMHRASPIAASLQQGFRSPPCSSPVSASLMRSPSRHVTNSQMYNQKSPQPPLSQATQQMLSFKPLSTLTPLQVSMAKRMELNGSMSPNANAPFLSPRREEFRIVEVPLQSGIMPEKPICTKKFKRRYVEEDDAASVITSEEDDCISPGYHTSLPMEVHGSCYSEMQMISQGSYQQLHCASVVITQHSFDLEAFTYYAISTLCQKNHKTYDVFYDWAYEVISVCPLSQTIICLLMAQFSARDQLPTSPTNCLNCTRKLDCVFHRSQFECRILFTWNMESGEWEVVDYGELMECKLSDAVRTIKRYGDMSLNLAQSAKKLAHEMATSLGKLQQCYTNNLRVLDSNVKKSKTSLTDNDNMIEFYLKRPRNCE